MKNNNLKIIIKVVLYDVYYKLINLINKNKNKNKNNNNIIVYIENINKKNIIINDYKIANYLILYNINKLNFFYNNLEVSSLRKNESTLNFKNYNKYISLKININLLFFKNANLNYNKFFVGILLPIKNNKLKIKYKYKDYYKILNFSFENILKFSINNNCIYNL